MLKSKRSGSRFLIMARRRKIFVPQRQHGRRCQYTSWIARISRQLKQTTRRCEHAQDSLVRAEGFGFKGRPAFLQEMPSACPDYLCEISPCSFSTGAALASARSNRQSRDLR